MNYTTVFECIDINISIIILTCIIAIILYALVIFFGIIGEKKRPKESKIKKVRIFFLTIAIILGSIYSISSVATAIRAPIYKENIYNTYVDNDTSVVEGYVNITTTIDEDEIERIDSVILDGIDFNVNSKYMYNYSDTHDLCIQNGDHVRITYVTYKNKNLIMKIEKIDSSTETVDS